MKNILITGGAGYIGSNFCAYLNEYRPEYNLVVYDNLTYAGNRENIDHLDVIFIEGDICNRGLLELTIENLKIDTIVHFAAESHVDNSISDPEPFIQSNIVGTYNLLECARKYALRFHHISTDEIFGDLPLDNTTDKFTENSPYKPSSPYSASKAASDHLVRAWGRTFGVNYTISNCSNNYGHHIGKIKGIGQHHEKFIPKQIIRALSGENLQLYGHGLNVRDWIHVDDHNDAVLTILEKGKIGETYLIGSNGEKTNQEVAELILKHFPANIQIDYIQDRAGHDQRYAIDYSKLKRELEWTPKHTDFEEGLKQTIEWFKENGWNKTPTKKKKKKKKAYKTILYS